MLGFRVCGLRRAVASADLCTFFWALIILDLQPTDRMLDVDRTEPMTTTNPIATQQL